MVESSEMEALRDLNSHLQTQLTDIKVEHTQLTKKVRGHDEENSKVIKRADELEAELEALKQKH